MSAISAPRIGAQHLLTPDVWAARYFDESSRPPETTLRRWMQTGVVPARKIGKKWYIDDVAWLAGGDALVARVLGGE